jgi:hypothetical protein
MHQLASSHITSSLVLATVFLFTGAIAAPVVIPRQSITVLSASQISTYKPYTYFASTGYCSAAVTKAWNCGGKYPPYYCNPKYTDHSEANCNANAGFKWVASGGDGDNIQYWFVGYSPTLGEIIVSHQGTDTSEL